MRKEILKEILLKAAKATITKKMKRKMRRAAKCGSKLTITYSTEKETPYDLKTAL